MTLQQATQQDAKVMEELLRLFDEQNWREIPSAVNEYARMLANRESYHDIGVYPQARMMQALAMAGLELYPDSIGLTRIEIDRIRLSGPGYPEHAAHQALTDFLLTLHVGIGIHSVNALKGVPNAVVEYERLVERIAANGAGSQDDALFKRAQAGEVLDYRWGPIRIRNVAEITLERILSQVNAGRELLSVTARPLISKPAYSMPNRTERNRQQGL